MKHFADLLLNKNNSKTNDQVPFINKSRRGIEIKSAREINLMKKSSRIVATVLREINDLIKPGMSTKDLDDFAEGIIWTLNQINLNNNLKNLARQKAIKNWDYSVISKKYKDLYEEIISK